MEANNLLRALNHLDAGIRLNRLRTTDRRVSAASADATHWNVATAQLHARVLKLASDDAQVRRSEGLDLPAGAQLVEELVKADRLDRYSFVRKKHAQVPLIAAAVDEPGPSWPSVCMLEALPEMD